MFSSSLMDGWKMSPSVMCPFGDSKLIVTQTWLSYWVTKPNKRHDRKRLVDVGLCICFQQLLDQASLMIIGLGRSLWIQRNIIRHNVTDSFLFFFASVVLFYARSLGHPASGSWCSKQCQGWLPLKAWVSVQTMSLVVHSHNCCATFTPAQLVGRTICRVQEILWTRERKDCRSHKDLGQYIKTPHSQLT